jgi:hypothetical protein
MTANQFIAQFLTNPRSVDIDSLGPQDIKEQTFYPEDNVLNSEAESFARIYYSSDGYDLGTAPRFCTWADTNGNLQVPGPITYEKDCIRRIVWALYKFIDRADGSSVPSLDDRARLVHHIWAHNYLTWRCQGVRGRDYLLVPFEALPPFERKKRYFVAELALLNSMFVPTYPLADNYCATLAMDVATYHVAFELVQSIMPNCDDPDAMIEYTDRDFHSPSTLH